MEVNQLTNNDALRDRDLCAEHDRAMLLLAMPMLAGTASSAGQIGAVRKLLSADDKRALGVSVIRRHGEQLKESMPGIANTVDELMASLQPNERGVV